MKKLAVVLVVVSMLTVSSYGNAADCDYSINNGDKFTKVRTTVTEWDQLTNWLTEDYRSESAWVSASYESDEKYFLLKITPRKAKRKISVRQGDEFLILMADGSVVTLYSETSASTGSGGDQTLAMPVEIRFAPDDSSIDALTNQNATNVRMATTNRNHDFKIHEKSLGDIRQAINCIKD